MTAHSPYFAACLKGAWTEGQENCVELKEDDPKAFELVASWLFRDLDIVKTVKEAKLDFVATYKLADKLLMAQLKNDLLDGLRGHYKNRRLATTLDTLNFFHRMGVKGGPLYRFFLDLYVWSYCTASDTDIVRKNSTEGLANEEVMRDCLLKIQENIRKKWEDPRRDGACVYHDHSDGSRCIVRAGVMRRA